MHTTIYAIAESPKDPNVIWVGTDDGNVQLTRDGGKTWTNVAANIAGPAEERLGVLRSRPATSTRAPPTRPSISTPSAT